MTSFALKDLELFNALIDVWIDEEEYDKVSKHLQLSRTAEQALEDCFEKTHDHCTKGKDKAWARLLSVAKRLTMDAKLPEDKVFRPIRNKKFVYLLWAKLIRAEIQKKGTECYFRRLDQLVAYLEKYIPDPYENKKSAKLAVIYLLELSSASLDYESKGFAERARRLLSESENLKADKKFCWFHELLARYNIGVAHFHISNYREAVLEFNYIIFESEKLEDKDKVDFYNERKGDGLIYLPAIIYRADIQLKLQLAYHALKTLGRCSSKLEEEEHNYKRYKADLIKIQAYQFLGDFKEASKILNNSWKALFEGEEQEFPYLEKNDSDNEELKCAKAFNKDISPGTCRQNVKGRLLSLAMDQHLNCLKRQKELLTKEDGGNNSQGEKIINWIDSNSEYLKALGSKSFISYFKAVEFEDYDRDGYWEQVADYLAWLAEIAEIKVRSLAGFCDKFVGTERKKKLVDYLFEKPPREDKKREWDCRWCDPKGIELLRLNSNHYDDFYKRIIKAFEQEVIHNDQYEDFISRLIKVEEDRNDLRIKDLELRYKSHEKLLPRQKSGKEYCWPTITDEKIREFELLPCCLSKEEKETLSKPVSQNSKLPPNKHYELVMERWDDHFLRHLESPSVHENQESGLYFLGLQRWNSSSPAEGYSLGGGYLVYHLNESSEVDYGIAIDPGFDFIRNLFHMGFSLNDIDIILISHAHIDHIRDFESIIALLFELAKRKKKHRKVHVILTLGIYKRLEYIIENPNLRLHIEPYIVDIDREIDIDYFEKLPNSQSSFRFKLLDQSYYSVSRFQPIIEDNDDYTVRIRPTRAYHDDHSGYSDSFGFLIDIWLHGTRKNVTIGYTGDTKWIYSDPKIADPIKDYRTTETSREIEDITVQYKFCDALIVHLGSLIRKIKHNKYNFLDYDQCPIGDSKTPCEDLVQKEGHPYLIGLVRILSSLYKCDKERIPLILLSEFGEELRGKIRVDLIRQLMRVYGDKMNFLPVDVG